MITSIDNNLRVLQIVTSTGSQYFFNPKDFAKISVQGGLIEGYYKIYHFWNGKQKFLSKKDLFKLITS